MEPSVDYRKFTIDESLATLFTLLAHDEEGIDGRWYRINSCKDEKVFPGDGSEPFDNPIPPLSELLRLGKARTNDMLVAAGLLETIKTGRYVGKLGVCRKGWDDLIATFKIKDFIECTP